MCDLSDLLAPRPYPWALALVRESFARQPDGQTCGAAAVRHGLLLGGLSAPINLLESLLEIRDNEATDEPILLEGLRRLGFEARTLTKPRKQRTADFLNQWRPALEAEGAFLLPCLYDGGTAHWVCLGAWDGKRAWVVDSFYGSWVARGMAPGLGFFAYTEPMFDKQDWGKDMILVRPGAKWVNQYREWLPGRPALLRRGVQAGPARPATVEAVVRIAAQHYLGDADYSYRELGLYLPGGVELTVKVEDPGDDAVLVSEDGVGEALVLVVRRAKGALTRQTAPELVLRSGRLGAAQLG